MGALLQLSDLQPGSEVARLLRPGERAIAIPVDEVVGGGGFVQPGDLVDVLLFLRGENGGKDSAQVVMQ
ncbi:MAG: RcpC/CpaB family pilus assembly protein, partial [Perlucidibaca sp.]